MLQALISNQTKFIQLMTQSQLNHCESFTSSEQSQTGMMSVRSDRLQITSQLRQATSWPSSLDSLKGIQLSSLVYEWVIERLDLIPIGRNKPAQREAHQAIGIAIHCDSRIGNIRSQYGMDKPQSSEYGNWREISNKIQADAIQHLTAAKRTKEAKDQKKRQREITGTVPSIVRHWRSLA